MIRLGLVLLAAGLGRRFGGDKLLFEVDGISMLARAMQTLPAEKFHRAALVGTQIPVLDAAEKAGYLAVLNPAPQLGISCSVALGLGAIRDVCDGILFAVCDQPWLTGASVTRLIDAFVLQPQRVAALSWQGVRGNPVIFPRDLFPELFALRGDTGGGAVIARHPERLLLVEAESERELMDVDERPI